MAKKTLTAYRYYYASGVNNDGSIESTKEDQPSIPYVILDTKNTENQPANPPGTKPGDIRLNEFGELDWLSYRNEKLPHSVPSIHHSSQTKQLLTEKIHEAMEFQSWADTDDSGMCLISKCCARQYHDCGCEFLSLSARDGKLESGKASNRHNFHEIHLDLLRRESDDATYSFSNPGSLVKDLLLRLAKILCDKGRGNKSIHVPVDPLTAHNDAVIDYHALLLTLAGTVRQFRKNFPNKYLLISIQHMSNSYPWMAALAVFLHVLSQLTRTEWMRHRLKIILSGDGIIDPTSSLGSGGDYLWCYLNNILYHEAKTNDRRGFCSTKDNKTRKSIVYRRILILQWNEEDKTFQKHEPALPRKAMKRR